MYILGRINVGFLLLFFSMVRGTKANGSEPKKEVDFCKLPEPMCQVNNPKRTLRHVLCKYPTPGPSQRCDRYVSKPIEGKLRLKILRRHNNMRNRVAMGKLYAQPAASNMRQLSWDDEIARYAQRWVEQCVTLNESPHDPCRDTPTTWVGQNVGVVEHDGEEYENVDELLLDFFAEVEKFDKKAVARFDADSYVVGHYAQMVWAETKAVGCARATYSVQGSKRHTRLVCNYSPAGIIPNEPVYTVGPPCSNCPNNTSCGSFYPGLCATDEQKREANEMAKTTLTLTSRVNKGSRFIAGTLVNGRCYCREEKQISGKSTIPYIALSIKIIDIVFILLVYRRL